MVARVQPDERPDDRDETIARLSEELALLRDELATVRKAEEKWGTRLARIRSARNHAEKSAMVISEALANRLRIDGAARGRASSLLSRRQSPASREEAQQLELIRGSILFDAAWYLRNYHDVVRSGEEPALHFLRHANRPVRAPGPNFDTARYLDTHPDVAAEDLNPLVHFLLSEEGQGADRYPPEK